LVIPVEATQAAANALIQQVRNSATLIPLNLITQCVDLGYFNLNLQQSIDVTLSAVNDTLYEITRLVSYKAELQAIVDALNASIDQFNAILNVIGSCGQQ
jgi:hypothetical protein